MTQEKTEKALERSLERLKKVMDERAERVPIQLPLWPEPKRGTPNSFIRSALFAAIQSKDRVFLKDMLLASQDGIQVKFTGEQLNQSDLDVWETIVHQARQHPLGHVCTFTAHSLLKALGLPTGNSQHKQLHETIIRLQACSVQARHEGREYFGPLIMQGTKDEETRYYNIELNRNLIRLFGENAWTALDWQQRQGLRKEPLTQALHAFYSSHRKPFALKLATIQAYTGSRNKQPADFKRKVRTSLGRLVEIGFLASFRIEKDLVTVERVPQGLLTQGPRSAS
jgi:hypothetical protein